MRRLGLVLLVAAMASGCLRSTTSITVKQDGSGTMDQEIGATPQALALLRSFGSAGAGDKPANVQMFGPEQGLAVLVQQPDQGPVLGASKDELLPAG